MDEIKMTDEQRAKFIFFGVRVFQFQAAHRSLSGKYVLLQRYETGWNWSYDSWKSISLDDVIIMLAEEKIDWKPIQIVKKQLIQEMIATKTIREL